MREAPASSKYDLDRWLDRAGAASEAQHSAAFSCDAVGCIAHVKGAVIAIARHPAAITDDCGNADVLVLDMPKPADCAVPVTVIDVFDRWRNGAYALYLDQNDLSPQPHVRVETVAAHRGDRPWSRLPPPHVRERRPDGRLCQSRRFSMRSANRRQANNQLSPNPERLQRQATTHLSCGQAPAMMTRAKTGRPRRAMRTM